MAKVSRNSWSWLKLELKVVEWIWTNPAMIRMPDEVASATGKVLSTPNSKLIGNTGIVKNPRSAKRSTSSAVSQSDLWWKWRSCEGNFLITSHISYSYHIQSNCWKSDANIRNLDKFVEFFSPVDKPSSKNWSQRTAQCRKWKQVASHLEDL